MCGQWTILNSHQPQESEDVLKVFLNSYWTTFTVPRCVWLNHIVWEFWFFTIKLLQLRNVNGQYLSTRNRQTDTLQLRIPTVSTDQYNTVFLCDTQKQTTKWSRLCKQLFSKIQYSKLANTKLLCWYWWQTNLLWRKVNYNTELIQVKLNWFTPITTELLL